MNIVKDWIVKASKIGALVLVFGSVGLVHADISSTTPAETVYNVRDFHNFTDPDDWSGAINAAIKAAAAAAASACSALPPELDGKVTLVKGAVYIPPGTYYVAKQVMLQEGVRLFGASKASSIIVASSALKSAAICMGDFSREHSNISVDNLCIVAQPGAGIGINPMRCIRGCSIHDCQISGFIYNIFGEDSYGFFIYDNYIHNATVSNIVMRGATAASITKNRIDDTTTGPGILLDASVKYIDPTVKLDDDGSLFSFEVSNNQIQSSADAGLMVIDGSNITVANNHFEGNCQVTSPQAQLLFAPSTSGPSGVTSDVINIVGNYFSPGSVKRTSNRAIEVQSAHRVSLIGVNVRGGTGTYDVVVNLHNVDSVYARSCFFLGYAPASSTSPACYQLSTDANCVIDWMDASCKTAGNLRTIQQVAPAGGFSIQ